MVVQFLPGFPGEFVAALELQYSVETKNIADGPGAQKPLPSVARRIMKSSGIPYGSLSISESPEFDFGDIPYGVTVDRVFTLTNTGHVPLFNIKPIFTSGGTFNFTGGTYPGTGGSCGDVIKPGNSCTIVISFSPSAEKTYSSTLTLFYKSAAGGLYVATQGFTGQGINGPVELGAGLASTCVRFADGRIKCWGLNRMGALGLGDTVNRGTSPDQMGRNLPFVDLGTGLFAKKVVIGDGSVCALLNNNKIKCWGRNERGQLGIGDTNNRGDEPGEMGDNLPIVNLGNDVDNKPYEAIDIVASILSYCALLKSGNVKCWGANDVGQLGLGDTMNRGDQPGEMGDNLPYVKLL